MELCVKSRRMSGTHRTPILIMTDYNFAYSWCFRTGILLSALSICQHQDSPSFLGSSPSAILFPYAYAKLNHLSLEQKKNKYASRCANPPPPLNKIPLSNLSFVRSTISFVLLENETHVPFQSPFPLSKTSSSSSSSFLSFSVPSLIPYIRYVLLQTKRIRSLSIFSLRFRRAASNKTSLYPSRPFSFFQRRCILFLLSPFTSEPSFTHAHRGPDHVFHTRVRVRAFARPRACVCAYVQKVPRFSAESVESHLLLFPTRSLCPPASTCISAILGSLRLRSTRATPPYHARSGLVTMILYDPLVSRISPRVSRRSCRRMKVYDWMHSRFLYVFLDFAPIVLKNRFARRAICEVRLRA